MDSRGRTDRSGERLGATLRARRYRAENPEKYKRAGRKFYLKRIQEWRAFLAVEKSNPCCDCGRVYPPCVMDFDHVRGVKVMGVGHFQCASPAAIAEIAKCDLVCANCHRIRTHIRRLRKATSYAAV